ncbi:hypothetical protein Acr_05g0006530 [Actinidia rufa]|uniref:Uncharacterized protein n=1 Tax=Actinidia rufa TaxID=165716 RepID=A0A7J0EKM8_9ERIC|nr:hypothetical protein Acr_05g0006530 [Actinidia rufa]
MASRRNVRYSRLAADEDDYDGGYDPRYDYTPNSFDKVTWEENDPKLMAFWDLEFLASSQVC